MCRESSRYNRYEIHYTDTVTRSENQVGHNGKVFSIPLCLGLHGEDVTEVIWGHLKFYFLMCDMFDIVLFCHQNGFIDAILHGYSFHEHFLSKSVFNN